MGITSTSGKGRGNDLEAMTTDKNELFELIVESSTDFAIFTVDARGFVTSWNVGRGAPLRPFGGGDRRIDGRRDLLPRGAPGRGS
jgi:hypothetical protein